MRVVVLFLLLVLIGCLPAKKLVLLADENSKECMVNRLVAFKIEFEELDVYSPEVSNMSHAMAINPKQLPSNWTTEQFFSACYYSSKLELNLGDREFETLKGIADGHGADVVYTDYSLGKNKLTIWMNDQ